MINLSSTRALTVAVLLSGLLWAAQARIGMIQVEKGKVSLNGRSITAPQLLEQGNTLVLSAGATVRLHLLGGAGEVTLLGPQKLLIDQVSLARQARVVQRGGIESVPDIGSTVTGATSTTRSVNLQPEHFRLLTPPTKLNSAWVFPIKSDKVFMDTLPEKTVEWAICVNEGKKQAVARGSYTAGQKHIEVAGDKLEMGTGYLLRVSIINNDPKNELDRSEQPFRLLSPEEKAYLSEVEKEMRQEALRTDSVQPLLQLASILLKWDQPGSARQSLRDAQRQPEWLKLATDVQDKAVKLEAQLNKILGN